MACITQEINAKKRSYPLRLCNALWNWIGLEILSVAHLFFFLSFAVCLVCSSLSVTASQLSLWPLFLFCSPPAASGYNVISPFYLSQCLVDDCSNCAATSESLKAKGQRSGCFIHRGTSGGPRTTFEPLTKRKKWQGLKPWWWRWSRNLFRMCWVRV